METGAVSFRGAVRTSGGLATAETGAAGGGVEVDAGVDFSATTGAGGAGAATGAAGAGAFTPGEIGPGEVPRDQGLAAEVSEAFAVGCRASGVGVGVAFARSAGVGALAGLLSCGRARTGRRGPSSTSRSTLRANRRPSWSL
jgi:hypothetical protein